MLSINLRAIRTLENHRGVGYMLFAASIFAPSFVALTLLEPFDASSNILFAALSAGALGLLITAFGTLGSFLALFEDVRTKVEMADAGTRSLVVGIALSLLIQFISLSVSLLVHNAFSYESYVRTCLLFSGLVFTLLFVASFYIARKRASPGADDESKRS